MDEIGIWAQIVFPNVVGLGGQALADIVRTRTLRMLCVEIFNDAMAELQDESGDRLLPMALLPVRGTSTRACARPSACASSAARRQHHLGPAGPGRARPREPAWDPLWEACARPASCRCTSTSAPASRR